jgi:hypothetical protein
LKRADRWIALGAPVIAMVTVGVGLEVGSRAGVRSALVYGAPPSRGLDALAWQVVPFEEHDGQRDPLVHAPIDVLAVAGGKRWAWHGITNADGVAEANLGVARVTPRDTLTLTVASGGEEIARGNVTWPPTPPAAKPGTPWAPFARRDGPLEMDVAVLGERVAPSFAASVWVRVREAATGEPVAGADVSPVEDTSLASFTAHARTDSRGWAEITLVPAGLAVSFAADARSSDGRTGTWIGGLVASPGAPRVATRSRWSPDDPVEVGVVAPPARTEAYVEIDDAAGRAWATSIDLAPASDGTSVGQTVGPRLAPGLYWVVAAGDRCGAACLGPGSAVRPFFVAKSDGDALALGPDPDACAAARDPRESARAVDTCLAMAVASPVPRWIAVDGAVAQRARDARRRSRGLAVSLGGVGIAVVLEVALLLRAAARGREATGHGVPVDRRRWTLAVALLTGLLGFALLAAFLVRLS